MPPIVPSGISLVTIGTDSTADSGMGDGAVQLTVCVLPASGVVSVMFPGARVAVPLFPAVKGPTLVGVAGTVTVAGCPAVIGMGPKAIGVAAALSVAGEAFVVLMSNTVTSPEIDFSISASSAVIEPGITVDVCTLVRSNCCPAATSVGAVAAIVIAMLWVPMIGNAHEYVSVDEDCASAAGLANATETTPAAARTPAAAPRRAAVNNRKVFPLL